MDNVPPSSGVIGALSAAGQSLPDSIRSLQSPLPLLVLLFFLVASSIYLLQSLQVPTPLAFNGTPIESPDVKPDLPVLVVGAGPTGLTLATVLARYGVPVRLVEQKTHLSRHTKATNPMQRNQELLFALGLLDPIAKVGGQMRRLMVHAYGKSFGPRTMRLRESPFSDVILCGQHNFEAAMADGLREIGVAVEFGTKLTRAEQGESVVRATLESTSGVESASFSYMIGCDGHLGVTREFTNLDFKITKTGVAIRQVDCRLRWRRLPSMEQMWLFYFDHGFAVVVPLPEGIHRVLVIEPKQSFPARKPTLEEMQTKLREITGDSTLLLSDPEWFSYTDLSMGLAPALQDKRIILSGDVGNPVLPNGGQGMNTGITDAFNLGWKLAAVYKHGAPQELLQTYDAERHAVRSALQTSQFNGLKYTTLVTPQIMQSAFRWLAEPLLDLGGEYAMAQAFSELTIHTRDSPLTLDAGTSRWAWPWQSSGIRAGDRALDAPVVRSDAGTLQLYDLIYRGGWTLLGFSGRAPHASLASVMAAWNRLQQSDLAAFVITTAAEAETESSLEPQPPSVTTTFFDLDEEAHRVYGVVLPILFLVRPDGHVGAKVRPRDTALLQSYLERWLPDASQAFSRS